MENDATFGLGFFISPNGKKIGVDLHQEYIGEVYFNLEQFKDDVAELAGSIEEMTPQLEEIFDYINFIDSATKLKVFNSIANNWEDDGSNVFYDILGLITKNSKEGYEKVIFGGESYDDYSFAFDKGFIRVRIIRSHVGIEMGKESYNSAGINRLLNFLYSINPERYKSFSIDIKNTETGKCIKVLDFNGFDDLLMRLDSKKSRARINLLKRILKLNVKRN